MSVVPITAIAPAYRALTLAHDDSIVSSLSFIAADDQTALALAQAMVDGHAVELWDGLRYIERFDVEGWGL